MLVQSIVISIIILLVIIVPIVSNIKTPENLHDWYFGKQAIPLWIGVIICLIVIWGFYLVQII